MKSTMHAGQGPHFLQIPGPSNVPKRVLQALSEPTIDHRSQQFADLAIDCIQPQKRYFSLNKIWSFTLGPVQVPGKQLW